MREAIHRTCRRQRENRARERERGGEGELNMGRREGVIYFRLGTQVSENKRKDGKRGQIILKI